MTTAPLLQIAREVGAREAVDADDGAELIEFTEAQLAAFADRIRADEREECAKVCDARAEKDRGESDSTKGLTAAWQLSMCASAIRSRK